MALNSECVTNLLQLINEKLNKLSNLVYNFLQLISIKDIPMNGSHSVNAEFM